MTETETISEKRLVLLAEIEQLQNSLRDKHRLLEAIEIVLEDMFPAEAQKLVIAAPAPKPPVAPCDPSQKNAVIILRHDDGNTVITHTKMGVNQAMSKQERRFDTMITARAYVITECEDTARNIQGALVNYFTSQGRETKPYRYDGLAFDEAVGFLGYISPLPQITHLNGIAEVEGLEQQSEWQFYSHRDRYAAMIQQFYEKLNA